MHKTINLTCKYLVDTLIVVADHYTHNLLKWEEIGCLIKVDKVH